jgi:hypothetical protein
MHKPTLLCKALANTRTESFFLIYESHMINIRILMPLSITHHCIVPYSFLLTATEVTGINATSPRHLTTILWMSKSFEMLTKCVLRYAVISWRLLYYIKPRNPAFLPRRIDFIFLSSLRTLITSELRFSRRMLKLLGSMLPAEATT